ncbi:ADP-ribose diphosphatase [Idiomarina xiamenensis]|uniref:ADP-ribose pyrophosphatase n=1 Tax=Idiomarina xiamenensis 10-D-4 TaxID=740709 RepID=K2JJV8_9GAMM|nr:ADP-ribose diphosphatase [Idiomarina xiamenensis]EKE83696.1 NUDIX family NTP pyrophosphohydrolase [Idiomarina xiamenensis 10-D-4]
MQKFTKKDVDIEAVTPRYQGFLSTYSYRLRHRLFAGGWTQPIDRELMERGNAVVVLPYDPKRDEIVLLEQFRVGALRTSDTPWLLEFVAGMVEDKDDSIEAVAHRELHEEAGLTAQRLVPALSYLSSPGGMSERVHVYVGIVDTSQAADFAGLDDENEDIRVHVLARREVESLLADGKIDNAASVIALQWLQLHRQQLSVLSET